MPAVLSMTVTRAVGSLYRVLLFLLVAAQVQRGRAAAAVAVQNHGVILLWSRRHNGAPFHTSRIEVANHLDRIRAAARARYVRGVLQIGKRESQSLLHIELRGLPGLTQLRHSRASPQGIVLSGVRARTIPLRGLQNRS